MTAPDAPALPRTASKFVGIQNVPLNFQLGEWRLFSARCRLAVLECGGMPSLANLPPAAGSDGYLLKGLVEPFDSAALVRRAGWSVRVLRRYPRHFVDLTTGYDDYLAKFSAKTRSTFKRKRRKFQELSGGTIEWREYRTLNELEQFLPLAQELSAKTYQERLLGAGLPNTPAFRSEVLRRAERDAVRAYILFLNGKPASYLYLPIDDGRAIYAHQGYDPQLADKSPGTVLQLFAMERLFAEPAMDSFDFTEGASEHKQLFATHTAQCADVIVFRRTPSLMVLTSAHAAFARAEAAAAHLLGALGIRTRLKKLLRALALSRG
jgi:CelD/BcsL family acetyltransferase involved in cellulose biosynthesis